MKKLNLACGERYKEGYVNIDNNKDVKADVYQDLNKFPWPFKNSEFDEVYCHHILEHLDEVLPVMEELWRVCKNKAKILIFSPHTGSFEVHVDVTHKRGFNTQSFRRCFDFNDDWSFYTKAKFKVLKDYIVFYNYMKLIEYFVNRFRRIKNIYERHFAYTVQAKEIRVVLEVVK